MRDPTSASVLTFVADPARHLGDDLGADLWRAVAHTSPDGLFTIAPDGLVTTWNPGAGRLFGYAETEIVGRPSTVLFDGDEVDEQRSRVERALLGGRVQDFIVQARRRDGSPVTIGLTLVRVADGRAVCAVARDLTEQWTAQAALEESSRRFSEAQALAQLGSWLWDAASGAVELSQQLYEIHAISPLDFDGSLDGYLALVHDEDRADLTAQLRTALTERRGLEGEYRIVRPGGEARWLYARAEPAYGEAGEPVGLRGICQDITERKQVAHELHHHNALTELLRCLAVAANEAANLEEALRSCVRDLCTHTGWSVGHVYFPDGEWLEPSGICHVDESSNGNDLSSFWAVAHSHRLRLGDDLAGEAARTGRPVWLTSLGDDPTFTRRDVVETLGMVSGFAFPLFVADRLAAVIEFFSRERRPYDERLIEMVRYGEGQIARVAERQQARSELTHQAQHDPLTGLPNRSLFLDRLTRAVESLDLHGGYLAVVFLDLDNFKLVNDSFGHDVGDDLLMTVARRLRDAARVGDTAARFGGDEFVLLLDMLPNEQAAMEFAERMSSVIAEPIVLRGGEETVITASVGIAIGHGVGVQPQLLLRDADAAMYRAKENGHARYQLFDTEMHDRAKGRLAVTNALRGAVERDELRLVYQPQVSLPDGALVGVEALLRWQHPERGLIGPQDFIQVAEETQLIVPIGSWVIHEACRQIARWQADRPAAAGLKMCVNVSAGQLVRAEFTDDVADAIRTSGVDPANVCIEVTESVLMGDGGVFRGALQDLKALGVGIAIDDFGTGYSSLAYLRRFPVDILKIDKAFVDGLGRDDPRSHALVGAVVDLAHALELTAVAEGVERLEQMDELTQLRCDSIQGYYIARPGPADAVASLLPGQPQ